MTVTPLSSAARPSRRRLGRRLVAASLAALLAATSAPALAAFAAGEVGATPSPTAAPAPTLVLAPSANGVLRPGQALTALVTLGNATAAATAPARVSLRLGGQPITDRSALAAWLAGAGDGSLPEVAGADVPAIPAGDDTTQPLTLAADDPALAGRSAGVYPLQATATVGGRVLISVSTLVVPADGAPLAPLGVVVPITAGPSRTGLVGADRLGELTAPGGALAAQLDAVDGTSAVLAVDPAVPAAIRVLGTSAPASATQWLDRLERLPNSRFALQFADADLAVQVQAGLAQPLQPASLVSYLDAADFLAQTPAPERTDAAAPATPAPTPSTSPTGAPEGARLPELEELTDIGPGARANVFWPAAGSAGPEVVGALGALGGDGPAALTLVPSQTTAAGTTGTTVPARAQGGGAELLVYDSAVSALLRRAAGEGDASVRANLLAAVGAQLALAAGQAGGRPLAVSVDRADAGDASALRATVLAATAAAGTTAVGLDDLAAATAEPAEILPAAADADRVAAVGALLQDESAIGGFATILDDPRLLTGRERAEILQLLAVSWRADPDGARAAVAAHQAATAKTLDSVGILSTNVILASYGSDGFRPYVRNSLGYPVTIVLTAQPDDPRLVVSERSDVRAQADSNTRVNVPIEARIGNGTVAVAMQLYSPTGVAIGARETATVEVHAEWEAIGIAVLVGLMLLFLVGGVIRTIRRRRARRGDAATNGAADVSPGPAPTAGSEDDADADPEARA